MMSIFSLPILLWGGLGLLVGSFLNVVVYRFPKMLTHAWRQEYRCLLAEEEGLSTVVGQDDIPYNLCSPRSACPQCQSPIVPWHNIPLLSYLWLRGKCAHCAQHISCRYPCVELLTGLAFLFIAYRHQGDIWTVLLLSVAWCLILALFLIDWDTQLLPDVLTLSLLWLGLIYHTHIHEQVLIHVIWGAVLGYMSLWAVYWLFRLLTGKEGMGFGDFKLLAALGAWLGWSMLPLVILLSSLFGIVGGLGVMKVRTNQAFAFGPYLILAGLVAWFWGDLLMSWYWQWYV